MFEFIGNIVNDLHPMVVHFPIALLFVSFSLDIAGRYKPSLHETGWILLVLGGLSAIPAVITGLIAHIPYEETASMIVIQPHEILGMIGTLLTVILLVWRWRSRGKGHDIGRSKIYLLVALLGMIWLVLLGGTGGNLVYQYGINVRAINPLLP